MIPNSDLQRWQQAIKAIETAQSALTSEELPAFQALAGLINSGNFEASESDGYIQVMKNALPQHGKNRLLKAHLTNFITLCEKYFKTAVVSPPQMNTGQSNKEFYYLDGDVEKGPLGIDQIKSLGLKPDTLVWTEGLDEWKPAKEVEELKILIRKAPFPSGSMPARKGGESKRSGGGFKKAMMVIGIVVAALAALAGGYFLLQDGYLFSGISGSSGTTVVDYSLIPVSSNGEKWGYINHKGEYVVNPQFEFADFFSDGLAIVRAGEKTGYINKKGEYVIPATYKYGTPFSNGLAFVVAEGGRITCIDTKGDTKFVMKAVERVSVFSEGLAMFIAEDGKYGFVDKSGNAVIKAQFESALPFSGEFARIFQDGKVGFINKTGRIVITPQFGAVGNFSEGKAPFYDGRQWGYINTKGAYAINPQFDDAGQFCKGLAAVKQGETYGYINKDGKLVINPQYNNSPAFSNKTVTDRYGNKSVIDASVENASNSQIKNISSFSDGLAAVLKGEKYGYINKDGNYIINPQFDEAGDFYNGIAPVYNANKWGFINKNGQYVINPQFQGILNKPTINVERRGIDIVESDYYDASEFIKLFFEREKGNTFDGINASTTLEKLSDHPVYGAGVNARERNLADYRQVIPITKDIAIGEILFRFNKTPIYTYNNWGGRTGLNFDATPDAIDYNFRLRGKAMDKHGVVLSALKTEIERRQGKTMSASYENGVVYAYSLIQDNGKLHFIIVDYSSTVTLRVAFNKEGIEGGLK